MTDTPTVGGQTPEGAGTPTPVSTETAKSIEGGNAELSKLLDAKLNEVLKPVLSEVRGLQSRQDKSDKVNREFMDEYRKNLKAGMSEAEAEVTAQTTIDNRGAEKRRQDWIDQQIANSSSAGNGTTDAAKVVAKYGLAENDPDVLPLLRTKSGTELELAVANIALGRAKSPQPSAAAATSLTGGTPPKTEGVEALTKDYQKDMLAARGNVSELKRIKEEARKRGVPVDSIVFV